MIQNLSDDELLELYTYTQAIEQHDRENLIDSIYPDVGTDGSLYGFQNPRGWNSSNGINSCWPLGVDDQLLEPVNPAGETWSRKHYKQQLQFFDLGRTNTFRLMIAANRTGKSLSAAYEIALHATGEYPDWWTGERYHKPPNILIAGVDTKQMRMTIQSRLLGEVGEFGTGLIRHRCLDFDSLKAAQKADTIITSFRVKHKSGGLSTINLKSYESGVMGFMGFAADLIWLDEEPPSDIYEECKTRLMTTGGKMLLTFTPLQGMTAMIESFLGSNEFTTGPLLGSDGLPNGRAIVRSEWLDVPHISYTTMREQLEGMPAILRDAKSRGIPALGSGAVYAIPVERVRVDPFTIPKDWKRVASMDFGYEDPTVLLWCAINPADGMKYIYSEHYLSHAPTPIHAEAIKQRNTVAGYNIPIVCDPSGGGRSIADGTKTRELYETTHNLPMTGANNSIAPGIQAVLNELISGKLKIFSTCSHFFSEFTKYRYEKGKLAGADHAMDCLRYLVMSGFEMAEAPPKNTFNDWNPSVRPVW